MATSLLTALLTLVPGDEQAISEDANYGKDYLEVYEKWKGASAERKELMLNALYAVLNEYTLMESDAPAAGAVGGLLARAVKPEQDESLPQAAIDNLRATLRSELLKRFEALKQKFPTLPSDSVA